MNMYPHHHTTPRNPSPHLEPEEREPGNDDGQRHVDRVVLAPGDGTRGHGGQVQEAQHLDAPVHQPRRPAEALRQLPRGVGRRWMGTHGTYTGPTTTPAMLSYLQTTRRSTNNAAQQNTPTQKPHQQLDQPTQERAPGAPRLQRGYHSSPPPPRAPSPPLQLWAYVSK